MTRLNTLLAATLLAFASLSAGPATAQDTADTAPVLLVNLTSDDVWASQMALGFARTMAAEGHRVAVFLNVRAVTLANRHVPQHTQAITGKDAHALIGDLLDMGVPVFVCPSCTEQAGLDLDDRIEGTEPGSPAFRELVMSPGTRIISY